MLCQAEGRSSLSLLLLSLLLLSPPPWLSVGPVELLPVAASSSSLVLSIAGLDEQAKS